MRENKIFKTSLMNIANEKFFYKLQELTLLEKNLIKKLAIEPSPDFLKPLHKDFLEKFTNPFTLRNTAKVNNTYKLATTKNYKIILLQNQSQYIFIAGDQRIINTFYKKEIEEDVVNLEFYYPISPKLAILITQKNELNNIQIIVNNNEIKNYNDMIFNSSEEQIYASTEVELKSYTNKIII